MNSDWIRHVQEHEAILSNEDIAEAYLVDKRIKRLEKYLDAGRRFETLPSCRRNGSTPTGWSSLRRIRP